MSETLIPFQPETVDKPKDKLKDGLNATLRPTNINRKIYATFVNICKLKGCNIREELERCINDYNKTFKM